MTQPNAVYPGNSKPRGRGATIALAALLPVSLLAGPGYGPWTMNMPVPDTNNSVAGGCPIESRDGKTFFTARRVPDATADLDIWINTRDSAGTAFGPAQALPVPVNTEANDFCPTPLGGGFLLFVSDRANGCGGGDIYITRLNPDGSWREPMNLGCAVDGGPNGSGAEFSPGIVEADGGTYLYYSSDQGGNQDIFVSELAQDGHFGPGAPVPGLNTDADDRMPTLTKDGLEIVFSSNRSSWSGGDVMTGSEGQPADQDVYYSARSSLDSAWSDPVNLSVTVPLSTEALQETRASFSWDRTRVNYGAAGEIHYIERRKLRGGRR
jgi:hypothetical protein